MALRIDNQDSIRGGIEHSLEERERSLQLLRRLPLRGDVHRGTHAADGRARIVDERLYQYLRTTGPGGDTGTTASRPRARRGGAR